MRNSTCYFPQRIESLCGKVSHYSASMWKSALDFRFLRSIGTNFPLHAGLCSIGIFANSARFGKVTENSPHLTSFIFLNLFHYIFRMMRKFCPNTPQEISASKLAENDGFCGNLRYGDLVKIVIFQFSHYKSMKILSCHSNQSVYLTEIKNINFVEGNVLSKYAKFRLHPPYGFLRRRF